MVLDWGGEITAHWGCCVRVRANGPGFFRAAAVYMRKGVGFALAVREYLRGQADLVLEKLDLEWLPGGSPRLQPPDIDWVQGLAGEEVPVGVRRAFGLQASDLVRGTTRVDGAVGWIVQRPFQTTLRVNGVPIERGYLYVQGESLSVADDDGQGVVAAAVKEVIPDFDPVDLLDEFETLELRDDGAIASAAYACHAAGLEFFAARPPSGWARSERVWTMRGIWLFGQCGSLRVVRLTEGVLEGFTEGDCAVLSDFFMKFASVCDVHYPFAQFPMLVNGQRVDLLLRMAVNNMFDPKERIPLAGAPLAAFVGFGKLLAILVAAAAGSPVPVARAVLRVAFGQRVVADDFDAPVEGGPEAAVAGWAVQGEAIALGASSTNLTALGASEMAPWLPRMIEALPCLLL